MYFIRIGIKETKSASSIYNILINIMRILPFCLLLYVLEDMHRPFCNFLYYKTHTQQHRICPFPERAKASNRSVNRAMQLNQQQELYNIYHGNWGRGKNIIQPPIYKGGFSCKKKTTSLLWQMTKKQNSCMKTIRIGQFFSPITIRYRPQGLSTLPEPETSK